MASIKIEPKLGELGDILYQGKPLKEVLVDQIGRQALEVRKDELLKMDRMIKRSPKPSGRVFNVRYDKTPSKCKKWSASEIRRKNIMSNIPNLPVQNSYDEDIIWMMQKTEGTFTVASIIKKLTNEVPERVWIHANVGSRISKIYKAIGEENESGPSLLKRIKKSFDRIYIYTVTKEFRELPKQVICRMVSDFNRDEIKKRKSEKTFTDLKKTKKPGNIENKIVFGLPKEEESKIEGIELESTSILDDLKDKLLEALREINPSAVTIRIEF